MMGKLRGFDVWDVAQMTSGMKKEASFSVEAQTSSSYLSLVPWLCLIYGFLEVSAAYQAAGRGWMAVPIYIFKWTQG